MPSRFSFLPLLALILLGLGGFAAPSFAAEPAEAEAAHEKHEAVPLKAAPLFQVSQFRVTNSMLVTWLVAAGIICCRASGHAQHQGRADWGTEFLGMARRKPLQLSRKHHRERAGEEDFLVFCHHLHFHPLSELVRPDSRRGDDRLGASHRERRICRYSPASSRRQRGPQPDLRDGDVFFVLWIVWALQANGVGGVIKHLFGAKGDTTGFLKVLMVVIFFLVGLARDRLDFVPPDFP